jgi:hypothetical protein
LGRQKYNELEDKSLEISLDEGKKRKKIEQKHKTSRISRTISNVKLHMIGVSEGEENENQEEKHF